MLAPEGTSISLRTWAKVAHQSVVCNKNLVEEVLQTYIVSVNLELAICIQITR